MKKKSKGIVSILLTLVMLISMIPISAVASTGTNLAANATVLGDSGCTGVNESADKAFDNDQTDTKWCDIGTEGWVAFKTADSVQPNMLKVYHANNGTNDYDANTAGNTAGYELQILADGKVLPTDSAINSFLADDTNWVSVSTVTDNVDAIKESPVSMTQSRDIYRLKVTDVGENIHNSKENAIRIYGIELFGGELVTVSFNAGEGTGTMSSVNVSKDAEYKLPICEFTLPEGKAFKDWTVTSPSGLEIVDGKIIPNQDVVLTASYIDIPDETPVNNNDGTHRYSNGIVISCSVDHYVDNGNGTHSPVCACGYKFPNLTVNHDELGAVVCNNDGTHSTTCSICGAKVTTKSCSKTCSYTDNGDGTHTMTCDVCGYTNIENHSQCTYGAVGNGDGTHNGKCVDCGATITNEPCVPSGWYVPTEDGSKHIAICDICGEPIPGTEQDHIEDLSYVEYVGNGKHAYRCTVCDEIILEEKCVLSDEYYEYDDNYCVKQCKVCDNEDFSTLKKHDLVMVENSMREMPGTEYKLANYYCKDCQDPNSDYFYPKPLITTQNSGKYLIQLLDVNSNDCNCSLNVIVNGVSNELHFGEEDYIAFEVDKTDEITVVINGRDCNDLLFAVTDGDDQSVVDFNFELLKTTRDGEVLWTNVDKSKTADFSKLDIALSTVPNDLSKYSVQSVIALQSVIDNIPPRYTKNQATVDASTSAIIAAVNALVEKEDAVAQEVANIELSDYQKLVIDETGYTIYTWEDDVVKEHTEFTGRYNITMAEGNDEVDSIVVKSGNHDITINSMVILPEYNAALDLAVGSTVYLTVVGTNILDSEYNNSDSAGIHVPKGASLFIADGGEGKLDVYSASDTAGIGSNEYEDAGNITIYSGTVDAASYCDGAGIGGGWYGGFQSINIYGGKVTGYSDCDGAGIGTGYKGVGGTINIYDGIVGGESDCDGAGIGCGDHGNIDGINITGGVIKAESNSEGAGIGTGDGHKKYQLFDINISNAILFVSSDDGSGIGGGDCENSGNITIVDSVIYTDGYDHNIIGEDRKYPRDTQNQQIKLDNVTLFDFNGYDDDGNEIYEPVDFKNNVKPNPISLDGGELLQITLDTDKPDGMVNVVLPNGRQVPAMVSNGKVSVVVPKTGNENVDLATIGDLTANYRPIYNAIDEIPSDLTVYTDESVAALNAVLNSVDYTLAPEKQDEVDSKAQEIKLAILGLSLKPYEPTVDTPIVDEPTADEVVNNTEVKSPQTGYDYSFSYVLPLSIIIISAFALLLVNNKKKNQQAK